MGFSCSWAAVRGTAKDDILLALGLVDTGIPDEARESPISGAETPNGWYVLFFNDVYSPHLSDRGMSALSLRGEVVVATVQEHAMYATSAYFQGGARRWWMEHDAAQSLDHLLVEGEPPAVFRTILVEKHAVQLKEKSGVIEVDHYFDVPLALAASLSGFRHDQWSETVFTTLASETRLRLE